MDTSRGMKASDILDIAYDIGLERPKITTAGEWDGGRIHILTYGPLAFRQTLEISSPAKKGDVEAQLRAALPGASEPKPLPEVRTERKRKTANEPLPPNG